MINYLAVFVGGGLGSAARLFVSSQMARQMGTAFPWGTLAVNLIGALIIGLVVEVVALKTNMPDHMRYLLVTGFLGGFTTFSAFSLETANMVTRGDYGMAVIYVAVSVIGTVSLVLLSTHILRNLI